VSEQTVADTLVYRLTPQQNPAPRCFVYFHGGSFVGQIVSGQWDLVLELVRESGSTGFVPIYPLAPYETAEQTVPRSAAAISAAVKEFGAENVSILGDSAGGTIAVAAVQQLRDAGAELPARLILLAPWLDLPMAHPDQAAIEPHDIMVRRDYLTEAGRVYAGALPMDDWRVSPLFGSFASLPPMHVFTGSHDVVVTDSRQLVERVRDAGGEISFLEARGMQHVYPIYPLLPEARKAKKQIAELLS
jgi:acetyl esterase/lipase